MFRWKSICRRSANSLRMLRTPFLTEIEQSGWHSDQLYGRQFVAAKERQPRVIFRWDRSERRGWSERRNGQHLGSAGLLGGQGLPPVASRRDRRIGPVDIGLEMLFHPH